MGEADVPDTDPQCGERWKSLVEIHNHAKSIFLCAEEFDPQFQDFLQPILELRHSLEHIVRAKAAELGINGEVDAGNQDYIPHSLSKAIGHEYRAFFDAADWFSVCIRNRITQALRRYSPANIDAVLPDYYSKLRPRVDQICREIADIRGAKDISKSNDLLDEGARKSPHAVSGATARKLIGIALGMIWGQLHTVLMPIPGIHPRFCNPLQGRQL